MSFLKNVVGDMLRETAQKTFIDRIHADTGISKDELNEVFHHGMSLMTSPEGDPIIMGKAAVYKFLDEEGEEYVSEGDVVSMPPHKQDVKHCTCPYDPDDDEKDIGTDPRCPYHGVKAQRSKLKEKNGRKLPNASLDCDQCKGEGCKTCDFTGRKVIEDASQARWTRNVDHIVSLAMKKDIEPEELQKRAERLERLGDPKAAIYFDAAKKYAETDVFREEDGDSEQVRLYDTKKKAWMGKATDYKNRNRLRSRADKLDMEYGAVRYVVRPYPPKS